MPDKKMPVPDARMSRRARVTAHLAGGGITSRRATAARRRVFTNAPPIAFSRRTNRLAG